ncbi:5'-3' exonuclease [Blattabacterium cuenoti]|uniref:5'-3' exonuclease n=1 Tax=Blattabacterium cuenoti TaxID=1653831 RepID=UPI00163C00B6|nr:5'-3' exonuclease H3TH domain-containing protein [Blattabacterium cuenoti]
MKKKKLFLIDAYPMIYQSYYAYNKNPLLTSKGLDTSPIMNFIYLLINTLNNEKPFYMGIIFDNHQKTFRKKKYNKYKSHRKETPKAIHIAIPYIKNILKTLRIHFIHAIKGYEADDMIGTIANIAEKKGYIIYIMTLDKDFCQLVTKNIKIYVPPFRGHPKKILGIKEIIEKFEVNYPKQVIDLWSMMGDYSDNIPGIPGIGKITATRFIKKYGNIEKLFDSTNELKGKLKENIENNKHLVFLYKKLITIVTNIPVLSFEDDKFYIKKPKWNPIKKILLELEFKKLLKIAYQYFIYKIKQ